MGKKLIILFEDHFKSGKITQFRNGFSNRGCNLTIFCLWCIMLMQICFEKPVKFKNQWLVIRITQFYPFFCLFKEIQYSSSISAVFGTVLWKGNFVCAKIIIVELQTSPSTHPKHTPNTHTRHTQLRKMKEKIGKNV